MTPQSAKKAKYKSLESLPYGGCPKGCFFASLGSLYGGAVGAADWEEKREQIDHTIQKPLQALSYWFLIKKFNQESRALCARTACENTLWRLIQNLTHLRCYKKLFKLFNRFWYEIQLVKKGLQSAIHQVMPGIPPRHDLIWFPGFSTDWSRTPAFARVCINTCPACHYRSAL